MILFEEAVIRKLVAHRVATTNNSAAISESLMALSDDTEAMVLKKLLLKPFVSHAQTHEFTHEVDMRYNVLFNLAKAIRTGEGFLEKSKEIAQHLISVSTHPNIKDGDLFIAHFDDVSLNNKHYEALGIYKFEDKETFVETATEGGGMRVSFRKGIGSKKPDKACLILFTEEPYTLLIIDSHTAETDYWQHDFINHCPKKDHVNSTTNFLTLTKNFITNQVPEDFEVTKADQIDLLNRSVDYFKKRDTFDKQEFEEEVFGNSNVIESFRRFDQTYRDEHEMELTDSFEIAPQAVKKQARVFKSVLKLDKNFHIYIHGNRELIEQGTDERGRKYYKIYYEEES